MPSLPTTRNRFKQQGTGENSNTWGTELNAALAAIDEAIDGVITIALVGNHTLVSANYVSDQARNRAFRFTGTGPHTVTMPGVQQAKFIYNAMTNTLTVSNGTNSVTLAPGIAAWVASDGANIWKESGPDLAMAAAAAAATSAAEAVADAADAETARLAAVAAKAAAETAEANAETAEANAETAEANAEAAAAAVAAALASLPVSYLQLSIHGGGNVLTTGPKGVFVVPFNFTIVGWQIFEINNITGSIVVDIYKDSYANYPPIAADSICGSEKPTLSSAVKNEDLTLTTWTDVTLTQNEVLRINVDSVATVQDVSVVLRGYRT
jgi:hypothetical protein